MRCLVHLGKIIILSFLVSYGIAKADCEISSFSSVTIGDEKLLKMETGVIQGVCGYQDNKECRYSQKSCETSIGCKDIMMNGILKGTQAYDIVKDLELNNYASRALKENLDKMKELASAIEYAKHLKVEITKSCQQDYLTLPKTSNGKCDPKLMQIIPIPDKGNTFFDVSQDNIYKKDISLDLTKCVAPAEIKELNSTQSKKMTKEEIKKAQELLSQDSCFTKNLAVFGKPDTNAVIKEIRKKATSFSEYGQTKMQEYLKENCETKPVPSMTNICENVTLMHADKSSEIKNFYVHDKEVRQIGIDFDLRYNYYSFLEKFQRADSTKGKPSIDVYTRLLEAARCSYNRELYSDGQSCANISAIIKEAVTTPPPPSEEHKRDSQAKQAAEAEVAKKESAEAAAAAPAVPQTTPATAASKPVDQTDRKADPTPARKPETAAPQPSQHPIRADGQPSAQGYVSPIAPMPDNTPSLPQPTVPTVAPIPTPLSNNYLPLPPEVTAPSVKPKEAQQESKTSATVAETDGSKKSVENLEEKIKNLETKLANANRNNSVPYESPARSSAATEAKAAQDRTPPAPNGIPLYNPGEVARDTTSRASFNQEFDPKVLLLVNQIQADKTQLAKLKDPSLTDQQKMEVIATELYKKNAQGKTVYNGEEFPWNGYIVEAKKDAQGKIILKFRSAKAKAVQGITSTADLKRLDDTKPAKR